MSFKVGEKSTVNISCNYSQNHLRRHRLEQQTGYIDQNQRSRVNPIRPPYRKRLKTSLSKEIAPEQAGFVKGKGTREQILIVPTPNSRKSEGDIGIFVLLIFQRHLTR